MVGSYTVNVASLAKAKFLQSIGYTNTTDTIGQGTLASVAGRVGGGPVVERTGSQTSVVLAPGERVAIGSLVRDSATSRGSLASGFGSERTREELVIVVWVETD